MDIKYPPNTSTVYAQTNLIVQALLGSNNMPNTLQGQLYNMFCTK